MSSEKSDAGKMIDMPLEDFKNTIIDQHTPLGEVNTMILWFESAYYNLRVMKDGVVQLVTSGKKKKDDPEVTSNLNGLYAEMTKIEQKVTFLKERQSELTKMGQTPC